MLIIYIFLNCFVKKEKIVDTFLGKKNYSFKINKEKKKWQDEQNDDVIGKDTADAFGDGRVVVDGLILLPVRLKQMKKLILLLLLLLLPLVLLVLLLIILILWLWLLLVPRLVDHGDIDVNTVNANVVDVLAIVGVNVSS